MIAPIRAGEKGFFWRCGSSICGARVLGSDNRARDYSPNPSGASCFLEMSGACAPLRLFREDKRSEPPLTRIISPENHVLCFRTGGSSTTGSIRVDSRSFAGTHPNSSSLCSLRSLRLTESGSAVEIQIVAHLDYSVSFRSAFRGKSPFFSVPSASVPYSSSSGVALETEGWITVRSGELEWLEHQPKQGCFTEFRCLGADLLNILGLGSEINLLKCARLDSLQRGSA